ncbi:MAG: hypothetical protein AAF193_04740, partial [Bacteroidota bacterium]
MKTLTLIAALFLATAVSSQCSWSASASPAGACGSNTLMIDISINALGSSAEAWALYIQDDEFFTQEVLHYDIYEEGDYRIFVTVPSYIINSQSNVYAIFSDAPSPGMGFCQENSISLSLGCLDQPEFCGAPQWGELTNIEPETCEGAADGSFYIVNDGVGLCANINDGDILVEFDPPVPGFSCSGNSGGTTFNNIPSGDYSMTLINNFDGTPGCSKTYYFNIPFLGVSDFGFTVDEVVQPSCEYYPFNDNSNFGFVELDFFGPSEDYTFQIYDVETGVLSDPTSVAHTNNGVYVNGFDAGEKCLHIFQDGIQCPQEICFEFEYDVAYEPIQY